MAMFMCTCVCGSYNYHCVIKSKIPALKWPNLILLMLVVMGENQYQLCYTFEYEVRESLVTFQNVVSLLILKKENFF